MNLTVLFDGDCHICDRSVQFIIKRDPEARIKFASLQSDIGATIQSQYHLTDRLNSLVFIKDDQVYVRSSAALHLCKYLSGLWKLLYVLILIPRPIRDSVYKIIANNRYRWFGKKTACPIPTKAERSRLL